MRIFSSPKMNVLPDVNAARGLRPTLGGLGAVVLALTLAACGASRPIKYHQLTYPTTTPSSSAPINVTLMVRSFDAPPLLREGAIVYCPRPEELGVYAQNRWIAPPVEMLQSFLVRGLRSSGRFRSVILARGEGGGDFALTGSLYDFEEVDGAEIVARLSYNVRLRDRRTGTMVWTHSYNYDEPASAKTVDAVVAAMDKNVQRSVLEVQTALEQYFANHPAS